MLNTMRALMVPFGAICMFLSGTVQAANPFSTSGWQRVEMPASGFSVMMPGTPRESTKVESTDGGGQTTLHISCFENSTETYCVAYNDYPFTLDEKASLKGIRDHKVGKGTLITDTDVSMNGHPGRVFTAMVDGRLRGVELFISGARLYQVIYTSSSALTGMAHGTAFIKSFQFTR
jgi:hypothetical protein